MADLILTLAKLPSFFGLSPEKFIHRLNHRPLTPV